MAAPKRYGCKFCGRWFTNPHVLGGHINSHTHNKSGVKPNIKCSKCGKKFDSKMALNSHKGRSKCWFTDTIAPIQKEPKATKAKPKKQQDLKKQDPKRYILAFYGEELKSVGTMKEIENDLRIASDMNELPDDENDIQIYEIAREIKAQYDRKVKVKVLE